MLSPCILSMHIATRTSCMSFATSAYPVPVVCMDVCLWVCTYVCMCVCVCVWVCVSARVLGARRHMWMSMYMSPGAGVRMCVCTCVHMCTRRCVCLCVQRNNIRNRVRPQPQAHASTAPPGPLRYFNAPTICHIPPPAPKLPCAPARH